jgi:2-polyprenyl-6-methoxyphenol hydroxylase-like FAD-dependent oxidoreductase
MLLAETMADADAGTPVPVGYPSREQSRALSPVEPACIAQDEVEPLLLAHLRAQPGARVALGTEVTGVRTGPDGALATLRDAATGAERVVHARLLVAADGARSAIRAALGIAMHGEEHLLTGYTTLFRAPLWEVVGEHRHLIYSTAGENGPASFIPTGRSDRWLFGDRTFGQSAPGARDAAKRIRVGAGVPDLPVRIEGSRAFTSAAQLAERFRSGPVFLAGDAAHRVTPRGGTGLNLALHDGFDLGWKLAWVLRAWARPALLDTYEAERRPVAEHTAARSADPEGSIRTAEQEVHADLGGRIRHVWAGERSTLDLLGTGLTLLAGRDGPDWEASAASLDARVPVEVRRLDALVARAVGAGRSALLVRPDGQPAAVLPAGVEPVAALRAAVASVAG